ncbi:hypothetical protein [Nonomuraea sp. NPDC049695]|uniref:hypothetical protein n=1 Tax=Nonomuraea sp. NPDC049695 TaxID=3154734 RepID=UPI003442FFFF
MFATTASAFAVLFTLAATAFLWRSRAAFTAFCLLLAVDLYQFVTLAPHYTS